MVQFFWDVTQFRLIITDVLDELFWLQGLKVQESNIRPSRERDSTLLPSVAISHSRGRNIPKNFTTVKNSNLANQLAFKGLFMKNNLEICTLMRDYAAQNDSYLQTFRDNISVPSSRIKLSIFLQQLDS